MNIGNTLVVMSTRVSFTLVFLSDKSSSLRLSGNRNRKTKDLGNKLVSCGLCRPHKAIYYIYIYTSIWVGYLCQFAKLFCINFAPTETHCTMTIAGSSGLKVSALISQNPMPIKTSNCITFVNVAGALIALLPRECQTMFAT